MRPMELKLDQYFVHHQLVGPTADYIRRASLGLARDIGTGGYASLVTEYQSRKMGVTVNTESRTAECLYAIYLDFDSDVEAFFEQPPSVDCYRTTKQGIRRLSNYTPDFLVLGKYGPYVVQLKTESKLISLATNSKDWIQEKSGAFRDLPADRAFERLNLQHTVVSTAQLSKRRGANIMLLLQSLDHLQDDENLSAKVARYLKENPVARLQDLANAVGLLDQTPLLRLIAKHEIFTDLEAFSLTESDACFVSKRPDLLRTDVYDALGHYRRLAPGQAEACASQNELPLSRHLGKGIDIVDRLDAGLSGRSARRWLNKIQKGMEKGLSRVAAATPNHGKSGNRSAKRPEIVLAYAEHCIRSSWTSVEKPSPASLWREYKAAAEGWHPEYGRLSHPTFSKLRKNLAEELSKARGGKRAANAAAAPTNVDDRALKSTRPFEMASCDHYLVDLECIVLEANGMRYTMRPWLTVLRDCYTKSVLAFWLTLKPPSRRNCALIIRQCLRTHGRLPESIIVDRGADFRSNYFSGLMSHCGIHLILRPAGHPRYGSEAERFFGQFKELWLSFRPGNRTNIKEVRSVSGSHRPQKLATLSLLDLWEDLVEFSAWFDHYTVPSSLASPSVLATEGLQKFSCSGRAIPYDQKFLIASAVDDKSYKVDPRRGIHIDAFHFWHPDLASCGGRSIPVRRDPEDPYRIYALIHSRWTTCKSSAAPAHDAKNPLRQIVEGIVMLDGAVLRDTARDDADRNLINVINKRRASSTVAIEEADSAPIPSLLSPAPSITFDDPFSAIAAQEMEETEVSQW